MALRIQQSNWDRLDAELRRHLQHLTIREGSGMRDKIKEIENRDEVIEIIEGDIPHKIFILFENEVPVSWAMAVYDSFHEEYELMVYTRRSHRRRGYGKKLIGKARRWVRNQDGRVCFFPETENEKFWLSMFSQDDLAVMYGEIDYREVI